MSLISNIDRLFHIKHPAPVQHAPARARPVAKGDGFDVAAPPKVNLGKPPPASSADDADYVTNLYHDLLHREPDPAGFVSHVRGLQAGMSRDEIKNVFLTSPEYRQLQGATPAAPSAPEVGSATATAPAPAPIAAQPPNYANIGGFNLDKIKDPTHVNDKYSPALRTFSAAIGTLGLPPGSQSLPAIADYAHQHGFPDARVAGKDLLDFGDGKGPIDVITDVGGPNQTWWFHNQEGDGSPVNPPGTGLPDTSTPGVTTTPVPGPTATPGEPGAPLTTLPQKPEYATAPIDKSSPSAAVLSAAKWAKATYPDLFKQAATNDQSGRNACMEIMTKVIGAVRAAGFDATRVVNHTDRAMTDGYRYGSDALALNGRVFDCYGDMGGASTPAANDVGEYTADRPRE